MASQSVFNLFLRYTIGVGIILAGVVTGVVRFWTSIPLELLAMSLMAPGLLIAPFLFASDTGVSTVDESAEVGFISDDPSQYRFTELSFPGRFQLGFSIFGLFVVGLILFFIPQ